MKMKGSYKHHDSHLKRNELVCDMKMKGSYKGSSGSSDDNIFVCDMEVKVSYKSLRCWIWYIKLVFDVKVDK